MKTAQAKIQAKRSDFYQVLFFFLYIGDEMLILFREIFRPSG